MRPAVRTRSLTVSYKGSSPVLKGIDLEVLHGEHVGLVGRSGSGKSTLLNVLCGLVPGRLHADVLGRVSVCGLRSPDIWRGASGRIGVVFQAPEEMFVSENVLDEMAFSLGTKGMARDEAVRRCTDVAFSLGIENTLDRRTRDLSGGEKQLVAIASQVVNGPELLLLDEPSSQLDPAGKERLKRVLVELRSLLPRMTIVQVEQDLEQLFGSDRVLVLSGGSIISDGPPEQVLTDRRCITKAGVGLPPLLDVVSTGVEMGLLRSVPDDLIGTPHLLWEAFSGIDLRVPLPKGHRNRTIGKLVLEGVRFRYPGTKDVLRGVDLDLSGSSSIALMGRNGTGKSTLGKVIARLLGPDSGNMEMDGECFYLFQRPGNMFFSTTVASEVRGIPSGQALLAELGIEHISDRDPALLSEGEKQRLGIVLSIGSGAEILVLDEPFKALDGPMRRKAMELLDRPTTGAHIIITNDPGTAAWCGEVVVLSKGRVAAKGPPDEVLCDPSVMHALGWPVPSACVISRRAGLELTSDLGRLGDGLRGSRP